MTVLKERGRATFYQRYVLELLIPIPKLLLAFNISIVRVFMTHYANLPLILSAVSRTKHFEPPVPHVFSSTRYASRVCFLPFLP